jgi:hypothetical protein
VTPTVIEEPGSFLEGEDLPMGEFVEGEDCNVLSYVIHCPLLLSNQMLTLSRTFPYHNGQTSTVTTSTV